MFGNVSSSTTIFSSKCQALYRSQHKYQNRGQHADGIIIRNESNGKCRTTHDQQCDEKGIFTADEITQSSKNNSAERAYDEAYAESSKRGKERGCGIFFWKKMGR